MQSNAYCCLLPDQKVLIKILRVMKLTAIMLFIGLLHVSAKTYSQRITLKEKDAPLQKIFKEIERQSGYQFFFADSDLKLAKNVTVNAENADMTQVLNLCFAGQPLVYTIIEKTVLVKLKSVTNIELQTSAPAFTTAPPISVHGRVTNENGDPVEGVTVTIKGTKIAAATTANGEFTINGIDANAILVFTSTNMETFEVKVNGKTDLAINLKTKVTALQDVIVNKGYYYVKQRNNTGNVSTLKKEDIEKQPVTDPILALQGRVAGLFISQQSGLPGSNTGLIRLRGQNSIANGNVPLFIVDGIPFPSTSLTNSAIGGGAATLSPFNTINPSEIESIQVLKDADATAIYGSRGANGVILITTKKGKAGTTKVDVNILNGWGTVNRFSHLLTREQYLQMRHEAFKNDGVTVLPANAYDLNGAWDSTRYTDWQKVFIAGTSHYKKAQVSLSGGTANTQFLLSTTYNKQTTVFPGDYYDQQFSTHLNVHHASTNKKFQMNFTGYFLKDNSRIPLIDFTSLIYLAPTAPSIYDKNGNLNWQNNTWTNPFAAQNQNASSITNNLSSNLQLAYKLLPGLELKSSFGYIDLEMNQSNIRPSTSYGPPNNTNPDLRSNNIANTSNQTWIIEPQLNFVKKIRKNNFEALLGTTVQQNNAKSLSLFTSGYSSDDLIKNIASASSIFVGSYTRTQYKYNAIFGAMNYNWDEKYLVNVTARRDGSSRFGPQNLFGNFWSVGTAWVFTKENFFNKNNSFLSNGKIRFSYGTTGNDQITDYQYLSTYSSYSYNYQGLSGLSPTRIGNPYYGWETVKKMELGLELGFIKDRILLNVSAYKNRTGNQLVGYPLPNFTGFSSVQANLPALIQNDGLEIEANSTNIKSKSFHWSTSFNISFPRNKLIAYPNLNLSAYATRYVIGQPLYIQFKYHSLGVDPQTGLLIFQDVNKDGVISFPQDLLTNTKVTQTFFGAVGNNLTYKHWQLDFFFQFVKQTGRIFFPSTPGTMSNQPTTILNRWQRVGDISTIQKFTNSNAAASTAYSTAFNSSDYIIGDASFVRLKNLSLSYSLPDKFIKKIHADGLRLSLQCQNLFTVTKYIGSDPETQGTSLPPIRMVTVGIQLNF